MRQTSIGICMFFMTFFCVSGGAFADMSKWDDLATCKSELEQFFLKQLDPIKENFEPAEYRVVMADTDNMLLEIFARTVPDAYLVGYDPAGGARARDFVTPEIVKHLQKTVFEPVAELKCPHPYPKGFFLTPKVSLSMKQMLGYIQFFWASQKDTEYMKVFQEEFERQFAEVVDPVAKHSAAAHTFIQHAVWTYDQYADKKYEVLNIVVDVYAEVWNGSGSTYDMAQENVRRGVMDPQLRKHLIFPINVYISRPWEEIEKELRNIAHDAIASVAKYFEEMSALNK